MVSCPMQRFVETLTMKYKYLFIFLPLLVIRYLVL